MEYHVRISGRTFRVELDPARPGLARIDGKAVSYADRTGPDGLRLTIDGKTFDFQCEARTGGDVLRWRGRPLSPSVSAGAPREAGDAKDAGQEVLRSHMPGLLVSVVVKPGQAVAPGDLLAVLEAMKMANEIRAKRSARVAEVLAQPGTTLDAGQPILRFV